MGMYGKSNRQLFVSGAKMITAGTAFFAGWSVVSGNEAVHRDFVMPLGQRVLDGETAHRVALRFAGVAPKSIWGNREDYDRLRVEIFGQTFSNPVGVAAGFDKDAEALCGMSANSGLGFVEVGSVTPLPQAGNDKPRVFRLEEDKAVINRYGFNSAGYEKFEANLRSCSGNGGAASGHNTLVGVNLGKNKMDEKYIVGYCEGYRRFAPHSDYVVVNLSSPNTPGLRDLQKVSELRNILSSLKTIKDTLKGKTPPILIKLSPDLSDEDLKEVADEISRCGIVDGVVISNTTVSRQGLTSSLASEAGGLSGAPLADVSNRCIKRFYQLTSGKIPIIGSGGIFSGADAYAKIRNGASLVQIYTALVYEGFPVVGKIKRELNACLERDGFSSVADAVGVDAK